MTGIEEVAQQAIAAILPDSEHLAGNWVGQVS